MFQARRRPSSTRDCRRRRRLPILIRNRRLRDSKALTEFALTFESLGKNEVAAIVADLARLDADPSLVAALLRRSFLEKGLSLVDGPACPLCDSPWPNADTLRDHLRTKLSKSEEARKLQESLLKNAEAISQDEVCS